jgi:hypothetical protein
MSTDSAAPMTITDNLYRLFTNRTDAYGKQTPASKYIKISSPVKNPKYMIQTPLSPGIQKLSSSSF